MLEFDNNANCYFGRPTIVVGGVMKKHRPLHAVDC